MSSKVSEILNSIRANGWKNEVVAYPHMKDPAIPSPVNRHEWALRHKKTIYSLYENDWYTQSLLEEMFYERTMKQFHFIEAERVINFQREDLYFYDDHLAPKEQFTLIDGGAYTGDSIYFINKKFGEKVRKVYAFEPDPTNIRIMNDNVKKWGIEEKVVLCTYGMYSTEKSLQFSPSMEYSCINDLGEATIQAKPADMVVDSIVGDLCIKMDIEGSELDAIEGSKELIQKYTPYMAICVYHRLDDIWQVPLKIASINDDYRFYLRCGVHMECYAVPNRHWF